MPEVTCHLSVSLDGYVAGPHQSLDDPVGRGGLALHTWHFDADEPGHEVDADWRDHLLAPKGAYVMGRNMFGPVRGPWGEEDWKGWWGEEPPYHAPVFVLTHHAHEPIVMAGGTTFHFVTDGLASALQQAKQVAGEKDVDVAGGASTVRQALAAGAVDVLRLDVVPVVLGAGESLFAGLTDLRLTPFEVAHSPLATHVAYRVG